MILDLCILLLPGRIIWLHLPNNWFFISYRFLICKHVLYSCGFLKFFINNYYLLQSFLLLGALSLFSLSFIFYWLGLVSVFSVGVFSQLFIIFVYSYLRDNNGQIRGSTCMGAFCLMECSQFVEISPDVNNHMLSWGGNIYIISPGKNLLSNFNLPAMLCQET